MKCWVEPDSAVEGQWRLVFEAEVLRDQQHSGRSISRNQIWGLIRAGTAFETEDVPEGIPCFYVTTQAGGSPGGRRHRFFTDFQTAEAALIAWARRRFREVSHG